jgi:hypothetical protein
MFTQGVALNTGVIPTDVDEANVGGSYMYAGLFQHDLAKVATMPLYSS